MTNAEKEVIRRAALVASWIDSVYKTDNPTAARELDDLRVAVELLPEELRHGYTV